MLEVKSVVEKVIICPKCFSQLEKLFAFCPYCKHKPAKYESRPITLSFFYAAKEYNFFNQFLSRADESRISAQHKRLTVGANLF